MKYAFDTITYKKLYPSSLQPGLFFGLAKLHKLCRDNWNAESLPLRPVISNIGTATYQVSKYLANLLAPLAKGEYTIESTKDFISKLKDKTVTSDYKMVSFDVKSLFTNVPLDFTIKLILQRIYDDKLIDTKIKKEHMKELLDMCTKDIHFSCNNKIYKQTDGVAMGSPLGPVIANIFMVELEKVVMPWIEDDVALWFRYVDDTFTFVKKNEIEFVKNVINSFHKDIQFTHETESNDSIAFLDVLIKRSTTGSLSTSFFKKETDTNIYINWNAFAPQQWKVGTLKGLFRRAFLICSDADSVKAEVDFLKHVFININGYPRKVVNKAFYRIKVWHENSLRQVEQSETTQDAPTISGTEDSVPIIKPYMCLPYKGKQGEIIPKGLRECVARFFRSNIEPCLTFKGRKLGSFFSFKGHRANVSSFGSSLSF